MNEAYGILIIPGLVAIMIVGLIMQFLRARDLKEAHLSPYLMVFNTLFVIIILMLFIFLALIIISKFLL